VHLYQKMRKSLGSKRQEVGDEDITLITRTFGDFAAIESYSLDKAPDEKSNRGRQSAGNKTTGKKKADKKTFGSKIFESFEFGYRRITIERPLRLSVQFSDERIETLRFETGRLNAAMQKIYETHGEKWVKDKTYGILKAVEAEVRAMVKADFSDLKEKYIKDLLNPDTWTEQKEMLEIAISLQAHIGTNQHDDYNEIEETLKKIIKEKDIDINAKQKKKIIDAVSWTDPDAEPVIKKALKKGKADPVYGTFEYRDQLVQFQPDSDLRDNEDVPLTAKTALGAEVDSVNEEYFKKEVAPHVADAWIDNGKKDEKDEQVGIVGYEIPFNRHFYAYEPSRALEEIDADLDELSKEIMGMLQEVHS